MRPKHYIKNVLIFVPLMYSQNLTSFDAIFLAFVCFTVFCFIASGVYIVNDIVDCEKDKKHPKNKKRPIASGKVDKTEASVLAFFLFFAGFLATALLNENTLPVLIIAVFYALMNIAYSLKLKHVVVLDSFCIAAGFVLRIYAGGAAIGENISGWLFLTIVMGSLFMTFGKRRGEKAFVKDSDAVREVVKKYDLNFLTNMMYLCAGVSITFYALWAMTSVPLMIYTVPVVIFIIARYLLSSLNESSFGDPVSVIFEDMLLIGAVFLFGFMSFIFLYGVWF